MAVLSVKINGRDYQVACDDGQEDHLRYLADEVDERVRSMTFSMRPQPPEALSLVLAALTMADEIVESKREIDRMSEELHGAQPYDNRKATAVSDQRIAEMESAMASTIEEIALRIEKITERIEIR